MRTDLNLRRFALPGLLVVLACLACALPARPAAAEERVTTLIARTPADAPADPYGFGATEAAPAKALDAPVSLLAIDATAAAEDKAQAASGGAADAQILPYAPPPKRFGKAVLEITLVNALVWSYDRYIRENGTNPGFRIGIQSWKENLLNSWEWDDNNFNTNQFAHPYHGNLYYNSMRANGFSYWESIPGAFLGSFQWEYFGEVHHPAINDWINTSVGGVALGEMFNRLATVVTDNTARGGSRTWKEVGGFLIAPTRGFARLVNGETGKVYENPPDRYPQSYAMSYRFGFRTTSEEHLWQADTTRAYFELVSRYGDPFLGEYKKPFDSFDFALQVNFGNDASGIGRAQVRGILYGTKLQEGPKADHLLAFYQHYDYFNTNAFVFGGQSIGASFLSRFKSESGVEVRTALDLNGLLLGATNSDYGNYTGRSYDYGPGLGFKFSGSVYRNGRPVLTIGESDYWIHTLNGTKGDHVVGSTSARLELPLSDGIGVGVDYFLFRANNSYRGLPDVEKRLPELRVALAFNHF